MSITFVAGCLVNSLSTLCPPVPDADTARIVPPDSVLVQSARSWAVMKNDADMPLAAGAAPQQVGQWSPPIPWDVIAIHATLLPDGRVLHYSYPDASPGSEARIWDPETGEFTQVNMESDIFCSGVSHLPDGTIYVAGGNDDACEFRGERGTHFFHLDSYTWSSGEPMADGRWYPATVSMPDGSVMLFSGNDTNCEINPDVEQYIPGTGLVLHEWAERFVRLYPRMHVLSDGRIAHVGEEKQTYTFDLENGWQFVANSDFGRRDFGTSVLLPGFVDRIMIIGGSSPLTNTAEIIDFGDSEPSWTYAASMNHPRMHADALILPDRTVLVCGGGRTDLYSNPELTPELYDPATDTWSDLAPLMRGRMYHATTVLLPDARVLVAGQDAGLSAYSAEIYEPPYLFRGPRPTIDFVPDVMRYGRTYTVGTPDAGIIVSTVLVRPSAVTHSINSQQRLVELDFTVASDSVSASVPSNASLAPPGHYMLFIVDERGIPSVAKMVRIEAAQVGDVNGDGTIDFADLVALLAAWGPCVECAADLDGDGTVGFPDLLMLLSNLAG